jgi:hypothetical protein
VVQAVAALGLLGCPSPYPFSNPARRGVAIGESQRPDQRRTWTLFRSPLPQGQRIHHPTDDAMLRFCEVIAEPSNLVEQGVAPSSPSHRLGGQVCPLLIPSLTSLFPTDHALPTRGHYGWPTSHTMPIWFQSMVNILAIPLGHLSSEGSIANEGLGTRPSASSILTVWIVSTLRHA